MTLLIVALCGTASLAAQSTHDDLTQGLRWRNIGPANMMGRIADIDALNTDYRQVLCASASGGVFKSDNGGVTWTPIFERYGSGSIGSVALFQGDPNIIWVGTGEAANRNSSGWGNGLYRSTDGGKNFRRCGLVRSHHIADIALHPTNPNIAYVAVVGHLWGYSGDRGLYKTEDGGQTWTRLLDGLPDDGKTGCTEVVIDPLNPDIVFAGFYHRLRQPHHFTSGGLQGGLFKSTDGGRSWRRLHNGLPKGETGMIDLSICRKYPNVILAAVEAGDKTPEGEPGSGIYRSDDGGESWAFLLEHHVRPFYHGQVEVDPLNPDLIYIVSRDFRISRDGGQTFTERDWQTDGGDDHAMWIAPYDSRIMYLGTDQGLRLSLDGGQTLLSFNNMAIGQYYAIGADNRDPYWVGGGLQDNGLWVGPSNSREYRGILNEHNTYLGDGDGFFFQADPTDWRTVYIVNHVGFAARMNLQTRRHTYITPTPQTISNYAEYFDPLYPDSAIRYSIAPGEYWFFFEYDTGRQKLPPQFRFNWSSPLALSPTRPGTLYFGGNHLFKSTNRGERWEIISPDLTTNDPARRNPSASGYLTNDVTGGENYCTITTVAESPIDAKTLWVGSDDGLVQLSRNGGARWEEVGKNLPLGGRRIWVSRVEPSRHQAGRCYLTLDNHRQDDMKPYVFVTEDYGQTWQNLTANLPAAYSCYVVREDPVNPRLLFVGTEAGVFFSLNRGQQWQELSASLPSVAVYDLLIHPRDGDLIAGTHGRSIWIMDDLSALRQWHDSIAAKPLHFFSSATATQWQWYNAGRKQPYFEFRGENPAAGAAIQFWRPLDSKPDSVLITIADSADTLRWKAPAHPGINRVYWDFNLPGPDAQNFQEVKTTLARTLSDLDKRLPPTAPLRDTLATLKRRLAGLPAHNCTGYHALREEVARHFGAYGLPLGPALLCEQHQAPPGEYWVEITAGNARASGKMLVRPDPNAP